MTMTDTNGTNGTNEQLTALLGGNPFDIRYVGEAVSNDYGSLWDHDRWQVFLRGCPGMELPYRTGLGHRKKGKPVAPCLADILYSLLSDSYYTDYSLDGLAKELGITVPSKAVEVHAAVHRSADIFRKAVPVALRDQVEALLQHY